MVLPIYVTKYWLSASLIETEPLTVVDRLFWRFPYRPDKFDLPITRKKVHDEILLKKPSFNTDEHRPVYILKEDKINDIKADLLLEEVMGEELGVVPILLDHYNSSLDGILSKDEINDYQNRIHYGLPISQSTRFTIDTALLRNILRKNETGIAEAENIVFITYDVSKTNRDKYIEGLVRVFSNSMDKPGIWAFSLDTSFSLVPMLGAAMFLNLNLKEAFKNSGLRTEVKLINAPGVGEIGLQEMRGEYQKKKLKPESFNHIAISDSESIKIQWKTKGSKFSGEIFGSASGILIDNRQKRDDSQN